MPVLFLIAIVVVLVGIFFAATGRGGELAYEPADHAPLDLGPVSAADIALLRPPTAMWGYNMQVTDEALDQIARAMRERDVTISYLQEQLAGYERNGSYAEPRGAHARQDPEASGASVTSGTREPPEIATPPQFFGIAEMFESRGAPEPFSGTPETFSDTPETFSAIPEAPGALESSDVLESHEAHQDPGDPEAARSSESREPLDTPGPAGPLESPEPPAAAEPPAAEAATAAEAPDPPRTSLILKASAPRPEPHEATQPSQALQDPGEADDATEPSPVFRDDEESGEATQPSATVAPDEPAGPQGAFDTHGWWAEQKQAARDEHAHRRGSGGQEGDSMAAAEEQGW